MTILQIIPSSPSISELKSMPLCDAGAGPDLIAYLLRQQELTAVEEFSRNADTDSLPTQAKYYTKLLPATPLMAGQQYSFEVDLDRCSGCKACVTACHSLNGLDEEETWRDVGLLVGGTLSNPIMQHVTTACHHCIEPACLHACPTNAYVKDQITGIVKHLDDQCFGCQYCTLACPYDVPKYHHKKGIVRKCDMCSDRLKAGEAPACVQACPHEAIAIRIVDVERVIENSEADNFLPGAPEPSQTFPTTTYKTKRIFPRNMLPADYYSVSPQHPHWPLIVMLVLTQLSVGAFFVGLVIEWSLPSGVTLAFRQIHALNALVFGMLALGASTLHLGRPFYAFRGILGISHSWLSREILAFGVFAGSAQAYAALCFTPGLSAPALDIAGAMVATTGGIGVFCSVMIYVFTKKEFWSFGHTTARFFLTSLWLGLTTSWVSLMVIYLVSPQAPSKDFIIAVSPVLSGMIVLTSSAKMLYELSLFMHLTGRKVTPLKRSALLMTGILLKKTLLRFVCGLFGGIIIPLLILNEFSPATSSIGVLSLMISTMFISTLLGELLERYLFFSAVASARMPGSIRS